MDIDFEYRPPKGTPGDDAYDERRFKTDSKGPESAPEPKRQVRRNSNSQFLYEPAKPDVASDNAEMALIESGLPLFHRGGELVEPCVERVQAYGGDETQIVTLKGVEEPRLLDLIAQSSEWEKFDRRERKALPCAPPPIAARMLLARAGHWNLSHISGTVTTPTLRPDGSILSEPGYDKQTQLYHVADQKIALPPMSKKPTRKEALAALALLESVIAEFPFADDKLDKAVALSALMTPVLRPALDVSPMHAIKAPTYGSGKSYLVNCASAIAIGAACPVTTAGKDEAETEKRLDAALLKGQAVISLDNINGELCSDKLAVAVEQRRVSVRPLGASKTLEIDNRATIFATGCNILVRGDMVRRTLLCSIDPNEETPEKRTFTRSPFDDILADRGKYIGAVMTIARAYLAAGEPEVDHIKLASFGAWSRFIQRPLVWLGQEDPAKSVETSEAYDPERAALLEVMTAWRAAYPKGEPVSVKALELRTHADEQLKEAMLNVAPKRDGGIDSKRLGYWLRSHNGKVVGDMKIVRGQDAHTKTALWSVVALRKARN